MAYISCGNLVVGYDGKAVSPPVSFTVEKGSYVCILGENGSGKTTLMRTLVGLQKKISGEILFGDGLCRNETGYLPQKLSVSADFPASVREIVLSGTLGQFKNRFFLRKGAENDCGRADGKGGNLFSFTQAFYRAFGRTAAADSSCASLVRRKKAYFS